jgi:hypothetical protein
MPDEVVVIGIPVIQIDYITTPGKLLDAVAEWFGYQP